MQEHRALFWLSPTYKFQINDVYFEGAKNTITNSISCLHKRKGLFSFYLITCKAFSPAFANAIPLATHMSIHSNASFLADPQAPVLPAQQNLGDPHQYLRKKTTGARDRLSSHGSYQIFFGGWGGGEIKDFLRTKIIIFHSNNKKKKEVKTQLTIHSINHIMMVLQSPPSCMGA